MRIAVADLGGPQIAEFLDEHIREIRSVKPAASRYALDVDGLRSAGVTLWSVQDGGALVGCGAIRRIDERHAEVKSVRTTPARKRRGVASLLLAHIIAEAKRTGFSRLSLGTGSAEFFLPARRLYEKFGFEYCEPLAEYRPDPHTVFMTKPL